MDRILELAASAGKNERIVILVADWRCVDEVRGWILAAGVERRVRVVHAAAERAVIRLGYRPVRLGCAA